MRWMLRVVLLLGCVGVLVMVTAWTADEMEVPAGLLIGLMVLAVSGGLLSAFHGGDR